MFGRWPDNSKINWIIFKGTKTTMTLEGRRGGAVKLSND